MEFVDHLTIAAMVAAPTCAFILAQAVFVCKAMSAFAVRIDAWDTRMNDHHKLHEAEDR